MSERKVLNKYYPPDFDPSKIPRMKLARNRQYTVRLMAPFNMRCKTCGEYIYKGKKFNARKEDVEGDDYLGIRIYRFYIKCTRCLQEISFKTDPKNTDYEIEAGATRNFMALKLAEEQAQREEDEEKEEEATNPMKLLEKRTQQSKQELELLESLEELKDLNRRQQTIDYDRMLAQYDSVAAQQRAIDEQEKFDEAYVKSVFRAKQSTGGGTVVEEEIIELPDLVTPQPPRKILKTSDNAPTSDESVDVGVHRDAASNDIDAAGHETAATKQKNLRIGGSSRSATEPPLRATLGNLIKRKTIPGVTPARPTDGKTGIPATAANESVDSGVTDKITDNAGNSDAGRSDETKTNGLSLLCSYSSSSDNESE